MKGRITDPHIYLLVISVAILVVGLAGAVSIYQKAGNDSTAAIGYEEGDGTIYPVNPEDSKAYQRNMELYGGKMNVLADQFRRWFLGLWHGASLAMIIACVTVLTSFGFFFAANHLPPDPGSDGPDKRD